LSAELLDWHDEHLLDHRRRLRTAMFVSLAVHGLIFALFAASPPSPLPPAPEYLAVELVAAAPVAASARPAPSPAPSKAEPAAAQPPEPVLPPPPAPPVAKAPVQVLPEETPGRIREAKPEPETVAKVEPKPVPKPEAKPPPVRQRRRKEEALSLDDAMAALENELGVDETAELLTPQSSPGAAANPDASATIARPGLTVTPEQAAWDREVSRRIRDRFPNFARYAGRGLVAQIEVVVSATGELAGEPKLVGTSGDLDFDRMALAVVDRAAPLPAPPSPGVRRLNLTSEER